MGINSNHPKKQTAIIFLQLIIVLIGILALAALLIAPQLEGQNARSTLFQTYFTDPFLAYVYLASIPFFVALYQAYKGLGYAKENKVFSQAALKTLEIIKYCALIIASSTVAASIYIRTAANSHDDPAGAVMLGIVITFVSLAVAATAAVFKRILQKAIGIKSENDLTV